MSWNGRSGCPHRLCAKLLKGEGGARGSRSGGASHGRRRRVGSPLPPLVGWNSEETEEFSLQPGPWLTMTIQLARQESGLAFTQQHGSLAGSLLGSGQMLTGLCRCEGRPGVIWVCAAPDPRRRTFIKLRDVLGPRLFMGFPGIKDPPANAGRCKRRGFDPWVRKIPWRRACQPTPVFWPGESHGQRSLAGLQSMGSQRVGHD